MLNKIILMGRLVADPELRQTTSGLSVATFRIAVDRNYQTKDSTLRQADFIPCVAWRQTADFISKYFSKGRMIALEGSLQSRSYEDKNGNKRTAYEVIVDAAYFADSKPESAPQAQTAAPVITATPPAAPPVQAPSVPRQYDLSAGFLDVGMDDGDLPF